ncbi:MAG: universal stress protein [Chloroflexi bacterium]|nr:universal stress protein [Chloroflexota bacterium]
MSGNDFSRIHTGKEVAVYKHIVVPLDSSKLAEQVLPFVGQIAGAVRGKVTLLHVVQPESLNTKREEHRVYVDQLAERAQTLAQDYLRSVGKDLRKRGVETKEAVVFGKGAEAIATYATKNQADLVAMSTHGRTGLGRWVLGSVADRVLHTLDIPVLLVRPRKTPAPVLFNTVVAPLDGSKLAESILPHVQDLAIQLKLKVALLQVLPTWSELYVGPEVHPYPPDLLKEMETAAKQYLNKTASSLGKTGLAVEQQVLRGPTALQIMSFTQRRGRCLIAICTHGRSGIQRRVLGSVAEKLVRGSGDPVLLLRPRKRRAAQVS